MTISRSEARSIHARLGADVDPDEFYVGIRHEMDEHSDVLKSNLAAGKTARAHLLEHPDYYSRLAQCFPHDAPRSNPSKLSGDVDFPSFYAILDENGVMVDARSDALEAAEAAGHAGGQVFVDGNVFAEPEPRRNPLTVIQPTSSAAMASAEVSRLPLIHESDYRDMPLLEAQHRVLTIAQKWHDRLIKSAHAYAKPGVKGGMGREVKLNKVSLAVKVSKEGVNIGVLSQNQKQSKILKGSAAMYDSMGLSLVPHKMSFRRPWSFQSKGNDEPTFCLYSTPECRATCLVFTGQRRLESGAYTRGYEYSKALQEDPAAFMRVFHACAVRAFLQAPEMNPKLRRFLRANVMSDIPWEIVAPGFMEGVVDEARFLAQRELGIRWRNRHDGFLWYDYSKTPFRKTDPNVYDLTYSFMGNFERLHRSVESGQRVAVVFVQRQMDGGYKADPGKALKATVKKWHKQGYPEEYYPWTFFDLLVANGDVSDIRPLDREDTSIVGLIYKPAMYKVVNAKGTKNRKGEVQAYNLQASIPIDKLDLKAARFLVRVMQPDPEAPPVVVPTQDPSSGRNIYTGSI